MRPFGEAKSISGHQTLQLMRRPYGVKGSVYVVTLPAKGVIGEVQCGFLRIYAPTPYSAVFLLHAHAPTPVPASIKIGFDAVRFGLVQCNVGAVLRFGLD